MDIFKPTYFYVFNYKSTAVLFKQQSILDSRQGNTTF